MCLLVLSWRARAGIDLVVVANRDEQYARRTDPLGVLDDARGVLGGRDAEKGGTWLGVSPSGRLAAVTNFRSAEDVADRSERPSRGALALDFLRSDVPAQRYALDVQRRQGDYGGFNLLVCDGTALVWLSNRGGDVTALPPGMYGVSNALLDTPWPKLLRAKERLARALDGSSGAVPAVAPLLDVLDDMTHARDDELPATGVPLEWERWLSSPRVLDPRGIYGTRSTTAAVLAGGRLDIAERRFDERGAVIGTTQLAR